MMLKLLPREEKQGYGDWILPGVFREDWMEEDHPLLACRDIDLLSDHERCELQEDYGFVLAEFEYLALLTREEWLAVVESRKNEEKPCSGA